MSDLGILSDRFSRCVTPISSRSRGRCLRPGTLIRLLILWLTGGYLVCAGCGKVMAESRQLTTDGRLKSCPVFCDSSGSELVFVVQERPSQWRLMRLKLEDLSVTPVSPSQTRSEFDPAYSFTSKHLAFVQSRGNLSLALVIRDETSGKEVEVPPAGGFAGPRSPAFSADGRRVLFSHADQGRQSLYSVNLEAGDRRTVVESEGINIWPDCSPDGKRLAWASSRDQDFEIYSAAVDGTDVRRLTDSPKQDLRPRYSPDGKQIVFMSNRDGNYEIYLMDSEGTNVRRMTHHPESDDYPAWHPKGDRLVIVGERNGRSDLLLITVP